MPIRGRINAKPNSPRRCRHQISPSKRFRESTKQEIIDPFTGRDTNDVIAYRATIWFAFDALAFVQSTSLGQQDNGYASRTSHCRTGRQNRLMRIQSRSCGMNSKLLPTVTNRELQPSSGMLYERRGSRFQSRVSGTWQKVFRDVWTQSGGREAGTPVLRNW